MKKAPLWLQVLCVAVIDVCLAAVTIASFDHPTMVMSVGAIVAGAVVQQVIARAA